MGAMSTKNNQTPDKASRAYDRDLLRIFSNNPRHRHSPPAAAFIRHHSGDIRRLVSKWTGEYQLTLDQVLDEMIERCRELKLRAVGHERQLRTDFTVLLEGPIDPQQKGPLCGFR